MSTRKVKLQPGLSFAKKTRGLIADAIVRAYDPISINNYRPRPPRCIRDSVLTITASGLGDCVVLTDLPYQAQVSGRGERAVWAGAAHFLDVMKFCPEFRFPGKRWALTDGLDFIYHFDCGPGHVIQRWQNVFDVPVVTEPKGRLVCNEPRFRDRVILHFDPEPRHVLEQQEQGYHVAPRLLSQQSRTIIEQFCKENRDLEFVEIGTRPLNLRYTSYHRTSTVSDLIKLIASGSWFVGCVSGPIHIATALGLRCIGVVNAPHSSRIVLPNLKYTGTVEEEWYYPQNVHLHQDNGTALVPQLSVDSLEAAFNGDVYPFWENSWLDMIYEYL